MSTITGPNQKTLEINSESQANVNGVVMSQDEHAVVEHEAGYTAEFAATPAGAGNCCYALQNNHPTLSLTIVDISMACPLGDDFYFQSSGELSVLGGGAATDVTNRMTGSRFAALVTSEDGANIIAAPLGTIVGRIGCPAAAPSVTVPVGVTLSPGSEFTVWATTGTNPTVGQVRFFFRAHPGVHRSVT